MSRENIGRPSLDFRIHPQIVLYKKDFPSHQNIGIYIVLNIDEIKN
jgi:hypothetical protein